MTKSPITSQGPAPQKLDDVLLAMDVVDTLRHRDVALSKELDPIKREQELLIRLRGIYSAQGIEVPDRLLKEGIAALEQKRFIYTAPPASVSVFLARLYVSRDRWLVPLIGVVFVAVIAAVGWQYFVVEPARIAEEQTRIELSETLPARLGDLRREIKAVTKDETALRLAETYYRDGIAAADDGRLPEVHAAIKNLSVLRKDIAISYDIRVVYGPNEPHSGIFRIPDDAPKTKNYYLIVEAVDAAGRKVEVPIRSEEDQQIKRTDRWAQRVSEEAFNAVEADKSDDQIIQNNIIGRKESGTYLPEYRVATPGGAVLQW